VLTSGPF